MCAEQPDNTASLLLGYIDGIDPNRWYNNEQQITCVNNICAFLQNTGGAPGSNIQGLAPVIVDFGCRVCGSVADFYPGDDNLADGELTFGYVSNPACTAGLC